MNRIALAFSAFAAISLSSAAMAADLPAKAPRFAPVAVFSWTGFYIGGNVGYHWGEDRTTTAANPVGWTLAGAAAIDAITPGSVKPSGVMGGGQMGFNWQTGSFLWGIEADANWLGGNAATRSVTGFGGGVNPADVFTTSAQSRFVGTLRPRVGWVADRALFYVTGGLAVSTAQFTDSFGFFGNTVVTSVSTSTARVGWTVGGGFEYAFANNWSAKFEYLYADFGSFSTSIPSCTLCGPPSDITVRHRYTENIARIGLNYRFGGLH